jgi:hypothetical protein
MSISKAMKMCRKILGPAQELPKPFPKDLAAAQKDVLKIIGDCYREHVERTRDPRDYVTCALATYVPSGRPQISIQSTEELILPEIVVQCVNQKFSKFKKWPKVKKSQRLEFVFHHIAVTKG